MEDTGNDLKNEYTMVGIYKTIPLSGSFKT